MTFQDHTNFFNSYSAHRQSTDRKAPCDLIRDEQRKAQSAMIGKFRDDLSHHLKSDLIRSYFKRSH